MSTTEPVVKSGQISVVKRFFGTKENQSMTEFAKEYKALSDQDKAELTDGILDGTLTY